MAGKHTTLEGKASRKYQIIAAIIGAAATLIAAGWMIWADKAEPPQEVRINGRVSNAQTDEPVRKAEVSVEAGGIPEHTESDSKGIFTARVGAGYSTLRVRVSARGFKPFDRLLPRDPANELIPVALEPEMGTTSRSSSRKPPSDEPESVRISPPPPAVRASMTSMLNTSLPTITGDGDSWAVLLFGDQERRDDVISSVRSALSGSGHDTISLFRKVSDEQRLAPEVYRGSSDLLQQLQAGRYCSRILAGKLSVVPLGTTEGITIARATLSVHVVSPEGDLLRSFELAEKGGGEDDSSARRRAVDELIDAIPRELPEKID